MKQRLSRDENCCTNKSGSCRGRAGADQSGPGVYGGRAGGVAVAGCHRQAGNRWHHSGQKRHCHQTAIMTKNHTSIIVRPLPLSQHDTRCHPSLRDDSFGKHRRHPIRANCALPRSTLQCHRARRGVCTHRAMERVRPKPEVAR